MLLAYIGNGVEDDIGFNKLNAHPADKEQYMRQNIAAACRTAVKQPSIKPFRDSILKKFKEDLPVYSDCQENLFWIKEIFI